MSELAPDLRDLPYENPWLPQHPRLAWAMASSQVAGVVAERLRARERRRSASGPGLRHELEGSFVHRWLEARLGIIEDACRAAPEAVWDVIDRDRLESLLRGSHEDRVPLLDGLLRAATVCWFMSRTLPH